MCFQSFHIWSKTLCGSTEAGLGFLHDHSGKLYTRHKCSLKDIVVNKQAVMAVFRGLKKYPAPQGMNMYRLSAHELCKALLAFFDGGGYWPSGLHSQIPACQEWALKTARGLVKLVSRMRRLITRAPISKMSKLNEIRDEITALKLPADGDDGSDTGTSTTNSDISALSASSKSSPAIDLESLSRKDDRLCRLIQQAQDQRRLVLASIEDKMNKAKQQQPVAFAVSSQYKRNMDGMAIDPQDDPDVEGTPAAMVSGAGGDGAKKKKQKCKNAKRKKQKAVLPKAHQNTQDVAEASKNLVEHITYKPGEFASIQSAYIEEYMAGEKAAGRKVSRAAALSSWRESAKRAMILSSLSVSELKKRRFIPKGCMTNPFKERIDQMEGLSGTALDTEYDLRSMDLCSNAGFARYPDDFGTWLATLVKHRSSAQLPPPKKTIELDGDFSDAEHFLDKCTKVLTAADGFPLLGISGDPCVEDFWQRF
ncbi:DAO domain-containing protein [Durusdinium trenchii]|uniref:DAO domain-containing protein n=1 Tax=Durusdinium trenchii TaxID=1381693 RepID=A0ABP0P8T2_9DINO